MKTSEYINESRRNYSMMVLTQRAIPSFADGLTNASRRIMWVSKRTGRQKSASLAGATLYLHPHGEPYSVVQTLGAKFLNNYPLLSGSGSWGTLLDPRAIGQPRYTTVEVSDFANDVLFADIDLLEMVPNYDETSEEPRHFLPLLPMPLINHYTGIAVGYAANILPRSLDSIIKAQIKVLQGKKIKNTDLVAYVKPHESEGLLVSRNGNRLRWQFLGEFERLTTRKIRITKLPFGITHEQYREKLQDKINSGLIRSFVDDTSSRVNIEITLSTKKQMSEHGIDIDTSQDDVLYEELGLIEYFNENLNLIDPSQSFAISDSPENYIRDFTIWRLGFYIERYKRELAIVEKERSRLEDIMLAIKNKANSKSSNIQSRTELRKWLSKIGVRDTEYVSSLPTYRFTKHEVAKIEREIKKKDDEINRLNPLIEDENLRKREYIKELREISKKYS